MPDDRLWYLNTVNLFEDLSEISHQSVASNSQLVEWEANKIINFQGNIYDKVLIILKGRVEVAHLLEDGRKIIITYLTNNDLWGAISPMEQAPGKREKNGLAGDANQARTAEKTSAIAFERDYFISMLERRPKVAFRVMKLLGLRQRRYEVRLLNLLFKSNLQKLASLILELSETYGENSNEGILISLGLSHEEMGAMIGLTREQVTKLLRELSKTSSVKTSRRRVIITDPEKLMEIAQV